MFRIEEIISLLTDIKAQNEKLLKTLICASDDQPVQPEKQELDTSEWKPIVYNDRITQYLISRDGKVFDTTRGEMVEWRLNTNGVPRVQILAEKNGRKFVTNVSIRNLVAKAYMWSDLRPRMRVKNINGDLMDCRVENLHIVNDVRRVL